MLEYAGIAESHEFGFTLYSDVYIGGGVWDHPEDQQVTIDLTKLRKID